MPEGSLCSSSDLPMDEGKTLFLFLLDPGFSSDLNYELPERIWTSRSVGALSGAAPVGKNFI